MESSKGRAEGGQATPFHTSGEMVLRPDVEQAYIFDHAWRQFKEKYYLPDITSTDWAYYYRTYRRFLPYITNNYDFTEMLSEMLGEVNASHTGSGFRPQAPNTDQTAELGLLYDFSYAGAGMKVAEVVVGGPADDATSEDPRGAHHREGGRRCDNAGDGLLPTAQSQGGQAHLAFRL